MDVEKDGKIFMGVGIGVGLIITIFGGSYLLQEKKIQTIIIIVEKKLYPIVEKLYMKDFFDQLTQMSD